MSTQYDREAWLTEAAALIHAEKIGPALPAGHVIPHPYRVSVGYSPRSKGGKVIAFCAIAAASADRHNEIFVSPAIDDSIEVLAALAHELVHQADDCASGHRNFFARVARRIGLEGPLTATTAGPELAQYLQTIVDLLGPIPHAKLDLNLAKKKQTTRMIKVACQSCDFSFRTSQANIDKITSWTCPSCQADDNGLSV